MSCANAQNSFRRNSRVKQEAAADHLPVINPTPVLVWLLLQRYLVSCRQVCSHCTFFGFISTCLSFSFPFLSTFPHVGRASSGACPGAHSVKSLTRREEAPASGHGAGQRDLSPTALQNTTGCTGRPASGPSGGSGDCQAHCHGCVPGHVHPAGGPRGSRKGGRATPVP